MNTENSPFDKISNVIKNSVTLKLVMITVLMLLLLIPASMIQSIIHEREQRNEQVHAEVRAMWADQQQINGPILTIPVVCASEQDGKSVTATRYWHLLPENLKIEGKVVPQKLKRGMYEIVVYESHLDISGDFILRDAPDLLDLIDIHYGQAFLTIGISDLRGLRNQMYVRWNDNDLPVTPGSRLSELVRSGITVNLPDLKQHIGKKVAFHFSADLQGSKNVSFIPLGNTTNAHVESTWSAPSFSGNFLPDKRQVNEDGFQASWSILQLNRSFPQSWTGNEYRQQMQESIFGVDLILAMDDYQKSYRATRYAALTIALTFLVFFLFEILNKNRVHPFQYALVGLALCLFYTLLVSVSEHSNFNFAYGVSTVVVVSMVALYAYSVFKRLLVSLILTAGLCALYGSLFIILQLTDYALLMGSIGLTVILGLTMYFTRNIDWYALHRGSD